MFRRTCGGERGVREAEEEGDDVGEGGTSCPWDDATDTACLLPKGWGEEMNHSSLGMPLLRCASMNVILWGAYLGMSRPILGRYLIEGFCTPYLGYRLCSSHGAI